MKLPKYIIAVTLAIALMTPVAMQTGCGTLEKIDGSPTAQIIIKSTLRVAAYMVAANNPTLAPWLGDISSFFVNFGDTFPPDKMREIVNEQLDNLFRGTSVTESEVALVSALLSDAMDIYAQVWEVYQNVPDPVVNAEMQRLMATLGSAINEGVTLVGVRTPATAPPYAHEFNNALLIFE